MRFQEREWAERAPAGALLCRPILRRDGRARVSPSEKDSIPGATERSGKKYFLFTFQTLFGKQSVQTQWGGREPHGEGTQVSEAGQAGEGGRDAKKQREVTRGGLWPPGSRAGPAAPQRPWVR